MLSCVSAGDIVDDDLALIARTGPHGVGSAEARSARERLVKLDIELLPRLLVAMDTPNVIAANWFRTIYEPLVTRELARPEPRFPLPVLKGYVLDGQRQGKPRRLVLELLDKLDPPFRASSLPGLLDDSEFRADAVTAVLAAAEKSAAAGDKDAAQKLFQNAFDHARQTDQVTTAAAKLKALGQEVSVSDHLGFITGWYLLGPFEAPDYTGFDAVFPPEQHPFSAVEMFKGASGPLAWKPHHTADPLGQFDLNAKIAVCKESVGYAYAEVESPREQKVQLRCGADDNLSVWVNGVKIFGRAQWLNGSRMDRFVAPAVMQAGRNEVLVKICQGPQHADPGVGNNWSFQLRFCDESGKGVGLKLLNPLK